MVSLMKQVASLHSQQGFIARLNNNDNSMHMVQRLHRVCCFCSNSVFILQKLQQAVYQGKCASGTAGAPLQDLSAVHSTALAV